MSETSTAVSIEVFSDYTCPWCYVGWARLRSALNRLSDDVQVSVRWRPFEIHPDVPPEGMPVEELPYPPEQWARMQEALRAAAAEEGLDVSKRPKVSNTHRALAAGSYAQSEEPARFPAFHAAIFEGYFAQGRDLGDEEVIEDLARAAGIDVGRLNDALASGEYEAVLEATSREARELGITAAPTFVFDRRFAAAGAQPADILVRAIESVAGQKKAEAAC